MMLIKALVCLVLLIVVPILVGSTVCGVLKIDNTLDRCLVHGIFAMWAIAQLISIPFILAKLSFLFIVIIISILYIATSIYGLIKGYKPNFSFFNSIKKKYSKIDFLGLGLFLMSLLIVLSFSIFLQHTDADDSRFGVNVVDILKTHRMFITNPATGEILGSWDGEVARDVVSPWAVFIAFCSYVTHIHPTIMFHTIIPIAIYIYIYIVYWMISSKLIKDGLIYRGVFIFVLTLLNIYGYASTYVAEARVMVRVWQGKTVVSGFCIPLLIYLFIDIYEEGIDKGRFILLLIVETAMCFLSGMGILIGAIMVGGYGLVYAVLKKDWKMGVKMWITALPCVIFYGASLII